MVTIKDVAQEAGVSVATVSRVMNKRGPLTPKTIRKVEDAVAALGYYPNAYARTLVSGKNNVLGVILFSFNNPFFSEMAQEMETAAKDRGYNISFTAVGESEEEKRQALDFLLSRQVDGILLCTHAEPGLIKELQERCKVPFVCMLHDVSEETCCVFSDDRQGGILAARHLYAKGCKKVVHVGGKLRSYRYADERTYAFEKECETLGMSCRVYKNEKDITDLEQVRALITQVFFENEGIDGLYLSNDILAAQCVSYALSQGHRIPDDIRIIGYDDVYISSLIYPPLTTIRQNFKKLAETAVGIMIDWIDGKEPQKRNMIPVELVERKTT